MYYFTVEVKREFQSQIDFAVMGVNTTQVWAAMRNAYPTALNIEVRRVEDRTYEKEIANGKITRRTWFS